MLTSMGPDFLAMIDKFSLNLKNPKKIQTNTLGVDGKVKVLHKNNDNVHVSL